MIFKANENKAYDVTYVYFITYRMIWEGFFLNYFKSIDDIDETEVCLPLAISYLF